MLIPLVSAEATYDVLPSTMQNISPEGHNKKCWSGNCAIYTLNIDAKLEPSMYVSPHNGIMQFTI